MGLFAAKHLLTQPTENPAQIALAGLLPALNGVLFVAGFSLIIGAGLGDDRHSVPAFDLSPPPLVHEFAYLQDVFCDFIGDELLRFFPAVSRLPLRHCEQVSAVCAYGFRPTVCDGECLHRIAIGYRSGDFIDSLWYVVQWHVVL